MYGIISWKRTDINCLFIRCFLMKYLIGLCNKCFILLVPNHLVFINPPSLLTMHSHLLKSGTSFLNSSVTQCKLIKQMDKETRQKHQILNQFWKLGILKVDQRVLINYLHINNFYLLLRNTVLWSLLDTCSLVCR